MQSSSNRKNSDTEIHNLNQKLVLHMWEDSGDEHLHEGAQQHQRPKVHRKEVHSRHHHRSRHRKHHHEEQDRIDIYVPKKTGPPTKPKPSHVAISRRSSSMHSKKIKPIFLTTSLFEQAERGRRPSRAARIYFWAAFMVNNVWLLPHFVLFIHFGLAPLAQFPD